MSTDSMLGGERPNFNFLDIIKRALGMSKGESLLSRVFTDSQREDLEGKMEPVARGIASVLAEFWNIPKGSVLDELPRIRVFKEEEYPGIKGTMTLFDEYSRMIIVNAKYLTSYETYGNQMLNSIEPALAEEICHYMEWYIKKEMHVKSDSNVKEFFGMVSRLYVADKLGYKDFNTEYRRLFGQAINFKNDLDKANGRIENLFGGKLDDIEKDLTAQEDLLDKSLKSGGVTKESDEIKNNLSKLLGKMFAESYPKIKDIEEEAFRIKHMTYHPAYAYYYQIIKMKPQERFSLLSKEPSEIVRTIMEKQERKLEAIKRLADKAPDKEAELDKIVEKSRGRATTESLKDVETGGFLEGIAKRAGFQGWGRGQEFTMQEFVNEMSFALADWWGMPKELIAGKIPRLNILPLNEFQSNKENGAYYDAISNEIYLSKEKFDDTPYGFMGWKAVLGEEVGHFIDHTSGSKSSLVAEFFGGVSRFAMADIDEQFKDAYRREVRGASNFVEDVRYLKQRRKELLDIFNNPDIFNDPEKFNREHNFESFEQGREAMALAREEYSRNQDMYLHILQKPAAYLFIKLSGMKREERYKVLTDTNRFNELIREGVVGLNKINAICKERLERELSKPDDAVPYGEDPATFKRKVSYPEFEGSGQFFENMENPSNDTLRRQIIEDKRLEMEEKQDIEKTRNKIASEDDILEKEERDDLGRVIDRIATQEDRLEYEEKKDIEKAEKKLIRQ
jgi:hypothetical protein